MDVTRVLRELIEIQIPARSENDTTVVEAARSKALRLSHALLSASFRPLHNSLSSEASNSNSVQLSLAVRDLVQKKKSNLSKVERDREATEAEYLAAKLASNDSSPAFSKMVQVLCEMASSQTSTTQSVLPLSSSTFENDSNVRQTTGIHVERKTLSEIKAEKRRPVVERKLINDILVIAQGSDGDCVRWNDNTGSYELRSDLTCPRALEELALRISELGVVFRNIQNSMNELLKHSVASSLSMALNAALEARIGDYRMQLASLEHSLLRSGDPDSISLLQVYAWAQYPIRSLNALLTILLALGYNPPHILPTTAASNSLRTLNFARSHPVEPGEIIGALYELSGNADPNVSGAASRLLLDCERPFWIMLLRWLQVADLSNEPNCFFIALNDTENQLNKETNSTYGAFSEPSLNSMDSMEDAYALWHSKFSIKPRYTPPFIDNRLANGILRVGKSIALLRSVCNDEPWVREYHHNAFNSIALSNTTTTEGINGADRLREKYSRLIECADRSCGPRLKEVFLYRFGLLSHLRAIRCFMLLDQRDFARSLVNSLGVQLDRPARSLLRNTLLDAAESAARSSAASLSLLGINQLDNKEQGESEEDEVIRRLDVRISRVDDEKALGWDAFSIEYQLDDSPLRVCVHSEAMRKYRGLFRFAWQLQRVQRALSIIILHRDRSSRKTRDSFLRSRMSHFLDALQYYVSVDILLLAWQQLQHSIQTSSDLEELIYAHDQYQSSIEEGWFLSESTASLRKHLENIFAAIVELQHWFEKPRPTFAALDFELLLSKIDKSFENSRRAFMQELSSLSAKHIVYDSLLLRLDFNRFYEHFDTIQAY